MQRACDKCTQGVMDADRPGRPGNDHLYGRCRCRCHAGDRLGAMLDLPPIRVAAHECGVDLAAAATELIEALSTAVAEQGEDS